MKVLEVWSEIYHLLSFIVIFVTLLVRTYVVSGRNGQGSDAVALNESKTEIEFAFNFNCLGFSMR